jgi:hypothetical protein
MRSSVESVPAKSMIGDDASEKTAARGELPKQSMEQQLKG